MSSKKTTITANERLQVIGLLALAEHHTRALRDIEGAVLAQTVLPDGRTMGEYAAEQLPTALANRRMPPLLGGPRDDD